MRGNNTSITQDPHPSRSKIADLLSDADAAWTRQIDHVSRANSTITDPYIALAQQDIDMLNTAMDDTVTGSANSIRPLNVNPDGSSLTYHTALHGADSADWLKAEDTEWDRLLETKTCLAIHLHQQPLDRRGDTTYYYNSKPKEKYDDNINKVYRIRGTAGGGRINYDGPTKANTAALSTIKILLQSVVSDNAQFMTLDIKDFYLMTPLPRPEYTHVPLRFLSPLILDKHTLHTFIHNNSILMDRPNRSRRSHRAARQARLSPDRHHLPLSPRHERVTFRLVVDDFGVKFKDPACPLIEFLSVSQEPLLLSFLHATLL